MDLIKRKPGTKKLKKLNFSQRTGQVYKRLAGIFKCLLLHYQPDIILGISTGALLLLPLAPGKREEVRTSGIIFRDARFFHLAQSSIKRWPEFMQAILLGIWWRHSSNLIIQKNRDALPCPSPMDKAIWHKDRDLLGKGMGIKIRLSIT